MPTSSSHQKKRSLLYERLLPLQRKGVSAAVSKDGFLLLFDQRTGKTWITLAVIEERDPTEVMIVGLKTNLESTWMVALAEHLTSYRIFRDFTKYQEHQRAFTKAWGHPDKCILLINYEALPAVIKKVKKRRWGLIIYDEIQKLKSRSSRNARLSKTLVNCSDNRLGLTGTPIDKHPVEMWSIMRFIDPSVLGGTWKEFDEDFLVPVKIDLKKARGTLRRRQLMLAMRIRRGKPEFKPGALEEFYELVAPHVMRVSQEDMGIERAKVTRVAVGMFGRQRRAYDQLEEEMVVDVGKTTIITPLKIVQRIKLQQLTGGFIYDEDKRLRVVGDAKARKLEYLLKKVKPPLVIFCKFKHEVELAEQLCRDRSDKVALIWGKVKDTKTKKRRTEVLKRFQAGELDYVICQQRTGGVGVDLYYARMAIVYSMGHSWIDYSQMVARLTFLYQDGPPEFFLLYVPDTIDEDILVALDEKRSVSEVTLERLRRRR